MKILAIDIGLKRIGISVSLDGKIATPLKAVIRKNRKQASLEVKNLLSHWEIDTLVVGIPMDSSNSDEMKRRFEHFTNLIQFKGKIFFENESLSSFEAKELIKGNIREKRDGRIDSLSAKIVLDRYLQDSKISYSYDDI
jgi:putative Holliday junction resolvase